MVQVRDLRKRYAGIEAASGVTFSIEQGEIFGLIGPNGAGKTTTVECVIGLREPDSGEVIVCGIDARKHPGDVKEKIGAALQTTALHDRITPREALALFGSFYRQSTPPAELIDRFALGEKADAPFDTLSGGQRQRLALALAFVNKPELVFLDEPTTGLDAQSRRELHAEIARMKRDGHTVLLTTHDIDEAEELCDRVGIIDRGRIIATGSPRELVAGSRATLTVTASTSRPVNPKKLARLADVQDLVCDHTTIRFRSAHANRAIADLVAALEAQGLELTDLQVRKATLEDVFIDLTARSHAGQPAVS
jgi:ABC-2 type transport system ATP-binding protein